jgi:hypothetical protein
MLLTENIIGDILHDVFFNSLITLNVKKCENTAQTEATQLLLAIKSYKDQYNKKPDSLADLIPGYFSVLPTDPFDDNFSYSVSDKKIYSVHASSTFLINF